MRPPPARRTPSPCRPRRSSSSKTTPTTWSAAPSPWTSRAAGDERRRQRLRPGVPVPALPCEPARLASHPVPHRLLRRLPRRPRRPPRPRAGAAPLDAPRRGRPRHRPARRRGHPRRYPPPLPGAPPHPPRRGGRGACAFEVRGDAPVSVPAGFPLTAQLTGLEGQADFQTVADLTAYPWLSRFSLYRPVFTPNISGSTTELRLQPPDGGTPPVQRL